MLIVCLLMLNAVGKMTSTPGFQASINALNESLKNESVADVQFDSLSSAVKDDTLLRKKVDAIFKTNPITKRLKNIAVAFKQDADELIFNSDEVEYRVSKKTGDEMMLDLKRYGKKEETPLISEESAKEIARKFIQDQIRDIQQTDMNYLQTVKTLQSTQSVDKQGNPYGQIKTDTINYIVFFERKIDNKSIVGPGGKIRIYVSRNGDVFGYSKLIKKYKKNKVNKKAMSPLAIVDKLAKNDNDSKEKKLSSIKFGYFEHGRNKTENNFVPAYEVVTDNGPDQKRSIDYYNAITGEKLFVHSQIHKGDDR